MAQLVAAFGSSHSIMLTAERSDWLDAFRQSDQRMPLYDRAGAATTYAQLLTAAPPNADTYATPEKMNAAYDSTFGAIAELKRQIDATQLDALVIVGDDQHELFQDSMMPALGIYYGATIRNAARDEMTGRGWYNDAQRRRLEEDQEAHYPVEAHLARHFIQGLMARDFDVCAMAHLGPKQYEGHAYSYIHRTYLKDRPLPVVPILLNTYYPPTQVTPKRCVQLGKHLRDLVHSYSEESRIGIIASGGLSHFVVDEELDRGILDALKTRDLNHLSDLDPKRLQAGSSEIRSWIVVAAAAATLNLEWLDYVPAYRTPALTGIGLGFARWS